MLTIKPNIYPHFQLSAKFMIMILANAGSAWQRRGCKPVRHAFFHTRARAPKSTTARDNVVKCAVKRLCRVTSADACVRVCAQESLISHGVLHTTVCLSGSDVFAGAAKSPAHECGTHHTRMRAYLSHRSQVGHHCRANCHPLKPNANERDQHEYTRACVCRACRRGAHLNGLCSRSEATRIAAHARARCCVRLRCDARATHI